MMHTGHIKLDLTGFTPATQERLTRLVHDLNTQYIQEKINKLLYDLDCQLHNKD